MTKEQAERLTDAITELIKDVVYEEHYSQSTSAIENRRSSQEILVKLLEEL